MIITNGQSPKKLVLYPLSQPLITQNFPMWVEEEEELVHASFYLIFTISTTLANGPIDKDTFISNFLQNQYHAHVKIEGINDEVKP
jgi:hypothetical protein